VRSDAGVGRRVEVVEVEKIARFVTGGRRWSGR
jgi:hypothetical protein